MSKIIAILFENKKEDSYIAIELDGNEPEILFTKGPAFEKRMGPYPLPYAEATFKRWDYLKIINPPDIDPDDRTALLKTVNNIVKLENNTANYQPENRTDQN